MRYCATCRCPVRRRNDPESVHPYHVPPGAPGAPANSYEWPVRFLGLPGGKSYVQVRARNDVGAAESGWRVFNDYDICRRGNADFL